MEALAFYSAETLAPLTTIDLGQVAPRSSDDTVLRVLNLSALYQASEVSVTVSGTDDIQLWLSVDGDVFGTAIDLGDVPPGALSQIFWLRRVTPNDAVAGDCTAQLTATATGWTSAADVAPTTNSALETGDN